MPAPNLLTLNLARLLLKFAQTVPHTPPHSLEAGALHARARWTVSAREGVLLTTQGAVYFIPLVVYIKYTLL